MDGEASKRLDVITDVWKTHQNPGRKINPLISLFHELNTPNFFLNSQLGGFAGVLRAGAAQALISLSQAGSPPPPGPGH